jgi:4-hydroxybenzoate polyprenyltransferase
MLDRLLALSRSTHGVLDVATPGFAALLWLGSFPSWRVLLLSIVTAIAGYTAIYALNDILGVKVDKEKFAGGNINAGYSVEASDLRHPLAQDLLRMRSAIAWFVFWCLVAAIGIWLLNPVILIILALAIVLETLYCKLLKVTWLRTIVSGFVKSSGPVAAVFVVVPEPTVASLVLLVGWLMCWEIGGQNIPADWNDIEEDRRVGAKTIPLVFGQRVAGMLVVVCLIATVVLSFFLVRVSPLDLGLPYLIATGIAGLLLLLIPGVRLLVSHEGRQAARLFDRASFYPLAQLAIVALFILIA